MGLERLVEGTPAASWAAILERLRARGESPAVKMVDGLPAFPGEVPEESCAEVRLGFPSGMVTLRRTPAGLACVVWGTASADLIAARDACAESAAG